MPVLCTTNTPQSHKVAISLGGAFNATLAANRQLRVMQNNHQWQQQFAEDDGVNGTPWNPSEGVVPAVSMGTGNLSLRPRAEDLTAIIPLIFGGAWGKDHDGGSIAATDLEPNFICDFFTLWAMMNTHTQKHTNCKTSQATFASSKGAPLLQLDWGIESCNYTQELANAFPTGLSSSSEVPFVHTKSEITVNGTIYPSDNIAIAVNNNLVTDESYNSLTRVDLPPGNQLIQFSHTIAMKAATLPLLALGNASVEGLAIYESADEDSKLTFTFPALHSPVPTPVTPSGNTPIRLDGLQWTARTVGSGATLEAPVVIKLETGLNA